TSGPPGVVVLAVAGAADGDGAVGHEDAPRQAGGRVGAVVADGAAVGEAHLAHVRDDAAAVERAVPLDHARVECHAPARPDAAPEPGGGVGGTRGSHGAVVERHLAGGVDAPAVAAHGRTTRGRNDGRGAVAAGLD